MTADAKDPPGNEEFSRSVIAHDATMRPRHRDSLTMEEPAEGWPAHATPTHSSPPAHTPRRGGHKAATPRSECPEA